MRNFLFGSTVVAVTFAAKTGVQVEVGADGWSLLALKSGLARTVILTDSCAKAHEACGGMNQNETSCCEAGYECVAINEWHHQCEPLGSPSPPSPSPPQSPSPSPSPDWITGTWTTGYWDCCKPSCSWPGKGNVSSPTLSCDATTGEKLEDANVASVCGGGSAASCADNQPFQVSENLSMGFAAVAVSGSHGLTGDTNCGQCFELRFVDQQHPTGNWGGAHPDLVDKTMIVQVTNIGYDVEGDHSFDIQIPGAGQGIFDDGCLRQYSGYASGDFDCDNNYGGCNEKSGCSRLPSNLRAGCEWRYDWYHWLKRGGQTNNPWVHFRRVRCPYQLVERSGSMPMDDTDYPEFTASN